MAPQLLSRVAKLSVTGTPRDQSSEYLTAPAVVRIDYTPTLTATDPAQLELEVQPGDAVRIAAQVLYQEATKGIALPHFEMQVETPEGERIQTLTATARDVDAKVDDFRDELVFRVPVRSLQPGATTEFVVRLEARLDFYRGARVVRSVRQTNADNPLLVKLAVAEGQLPETPPAASSELTLLCQSAHSGMVRGDTGYWFVDPLPRALDEDLRLVQGELDAHWASGPRLTKPWSSAFNVQLLARVLPSDAPALLRSRVVEQHLDETGALLEEVELEAFDREHTITAEAFEAELPLRVAHFFRERGSWKWHRDGTPPTPAGPYAKQFVWSASLELSSGQTLRQTMQVRVAVPGDKIARLQTLADEVAANDAVAELGLLLALTRGDPSDGSDGSDATGSGAGAEPLGEDAGLLLAALGTYCNLSAREQGYRVISKADREFDPNYAAVYDKPAKHPARAPEAELPESLWIFLTAERQAASLARAIDNNFTRYLSARRSQDDEAAAHQREAIEDQMRRLGDAMLAMQAQREEVAALLADIARNRGSAPGLALAQRLAQLREAGIDDEARARLLANGVPVATVNAFEQGLRQLSVDESRLPQVLASLPGRADALVVTASAHYFESLERLRELRRLAKLPLPDLLSELRERGVVSFEEHLTLIEQIGFSYALATLEQLPAPALAQLEARGIRSTAELLEACRTPHQRARLQAELGDALDVLLWANLADHLRINDLDEGQARRLEELGVDTVKELAQRNPANLQRSWAELDPARAPSVAQLAYWIARAARLRRALEY